MADWRLSDFFTAGYAFAGTYGSFYDVADDPLGDYADGTQRISIKRTITMPYKFGIAAHNFINQFREYGRNYHMGYSVENRDQFSHYADRESYLCHVLFLSGLRDYVNGASASTDIISFTLAQLLSYAIDRSLLLAINITSMEDIVGTVLESGDIILCRTAAGTTAESLYGIGDMYVWDEQNSCGLKWTINGLVESQDIRHPAVVFRPLLVRYGLSGFGREDFDKYINLVHTTKKNNYVVQESYTDISSGSSGKGGTIDTNTAKKYIWTKLMQELNNEFGTAGLMGNLAHESGFASNNLQNTYEQSLGFTDQAYTEAVDNGTYTNFVHDSAGYGLAQWTYYSRKQNLLNYCKQCGTSIGDLAMQTAFLIQELKGYTNVWQSLLTAGTVREASDSVLLEFERPADQSEAVQQRRANSGEAIYNEFHGTDTSTDVILNTSVQPNGAKTVVATDDTQYEASGLIKTAKGGDTSIDTSAWSTTAWPNATYHMSSGVGPRWGSTHNGIDFWAKNYDWNRYTIARCKILDIRRNVTDHWLPTDKTYTYWYLESNPDYVVPASQITTGMGSTIQYEILDGQGVTVREMHYVPNSIPASLSVGDILEAGTFIGVGGNTGKSTGRHIHFEMRTASGDVLDPEPWLRFKLQFDDDED